MTVAATVHVPSGTLRWARDRASATIEDAAARCDCEPTDVAAWEEGSADPPLTAMRELATLYGVPLSAFLLSRPSQKPLPTVDRRMRAGAEEGKTTRLSARALHRAAELQEVARRLLVFTDVSEVETATDEVDPEELAAAQRAGLGISVEQQRKWRDEHVALRSWRDAIERRGVFVLQIPMPRADVRAFSLSERPPFIVLNRSDFVRARIFSLLHEYCHVLLGSSGICAPGTGRQAMLEMGPEHYCNRFAGAFLVPRDALAGDPDARRIAEMEAVPDDRSLDRIGRRFHVSRGVVWYRLREVGFLSLAIFNAKWDEWGDWYPTAPGGGGPITTADGVVRDYGVGLPSLLLAAARREAITTTDVAQYLAVPHGALPSIEATVAARMAG